MDYSILSGITLPVFKYSTMWGTQYFFCKIDGEPDEGNVLFAFPDPTEQSDVNYHTNVKTNT